MENLHEAAANGDLKSLRKAFRTSYTLQDNRKRSPLHVACEVGQLGVVQFLLKEKGIELNQQDQSLNTPILSASVQQESDDDTILQNRLQICKLLVEKGADINIVSAKKSTVLHGLVLFSYSKLLEEVIYLLLAKGININALNYQNQTPLMLACTRKVDDFCSIIRTFIDKYSADVNLVDKFGENCAHYAVNANNLSLFKLLRTRCVDLSIQGNYGSVYNLIETRNKVEFFEYLKIRNLLVFWVSFTKWMIFFVKLNLQEKNNKFLNVLRIWKKNLQHYS